MGSYKNGKRKCRGIMFKIKKEELIDTAQIMFEYTWGGVTK